MSPVAKAPPGLDTPLQYLKGVGPQRARQLERLGLVTVRDALNHFPRDYQDRREFVPFHKLPLGATGVVQGTVFGVAPPRRGSRAPLQVTFRDQTGYFTALWFGRRLPRPAVFKRDQRVVLYGKKALAKDRRVVLENPEFEIGRGRRAGLDPHGPGGARLPAHRGPVPAGDAAAPARYRRGPRRAGARHPARGAPPPPEPPAGGRGLPGGPLPRARSRTWRRPAGGSPSRTSSCSRSGSRSSAGGRRASTGRPLAPPGALVARLLRELPFALTPAQERVWSEIRSDLARPVPMNRLLQGDVGSGKTIVAVMALLTAVEAGCQAVLMAPTEILAEQHFRTLRALVEPLGLTVAWLSAGQRARERQAALEAAPQRRRRHRRGHARPHPGRGGAPAPRAGRRRRAAPVRRAPARVAPREGRAPARAGHDRDADPPHPRPDALRRPRRLRARPAAARADADP